MIRRAILLLLAGSVGIAVAGVPATPPPSPGAASVEQVLERRCGQCHTRERIDRARQRGEDLGAIAARMEQRGAQLSAQEKSTLTAFWGNPLLPSTPPAAAEVGGLAAYRSLIETRCLQCHTRERIDEAIARQVPLQSVEAVLLRRGVVLDRGESEVLRAFWGKPLSR